MRWKSLFLTQKQINARNWQAEVDKNLNWEYNQYRSILAKGIFIMTLTIAKAPNRWITMRHCAELNPEA